MIQEDYVSFETANLLKEKGFEELCYQKYDSDGELSFNHVGYVNSEKPCDDFYALAPTLQRVMKWLREVYKIDISIYPYGNYSSDNYQFDVYKNKHLIVSKDDGYMIYEQACEAAIKYSLENLI